MNTSIQRPVPYHWHNKINPDAYTWVATHAVREAHNMQKAIELELHLFWTASIGCDEYLDLECKTLDECRAWVDDYQYDNKTDELVEYIQYGWMDNGERLIVGSL